MTPCEQKDRISALEKRADEHTDILKEIRDLARSTDIAIRGDPAMGLEGIVNRQVQHEARLDNIENTILDYEKKKWYAQGAVWVFGGVVAGVFWLVEKFPPFSK